MNNNQRTTQGLGYTFFWNFVDGGTSSLYSPSYTYNTSGKWDVALYITNSIGCMDSLVKSGFIQVVTGIKEQMYGTHLASIFPNPFSQQAVLQFDSFIQNATLTVYNSFGQTDK